MGENRVVLLELNVVANYYEDIEGIDKMFVIFQHHNRNDKIHVMLLACTALSLFLLSGCAVKTTAQSTFEALKATGDFAREKQKRCEDENNKKYPDEIALFEQKFILSDQDPRRIEKLMSSEVVTPANRAAFLRLFSARSCYREMISDIRGASPQIAQVRESFANKRDDLRVLLLEERITFGQYNKSLVEMITLARQQEQSAWELQARGLNSMHQNEMNQRAAAWAAFSESMAAAAQQNAQALQQMQNSLQQSRPLQTNCYKAGITISCTTY